MTDSQPLDICLVQINYNSESIQDHLDRIKDIIRRHRSADLLVFPN
jgi:predicted amidohydrolase